MSRFTLYKLQCIKDSSKNYEVDSTINNPEGAANVFKRVMELHLEAEEVLGLLALNTKNKVIGCFEVSRGSISSSVVHPREVMKRVLLMNATSFVVAHNHPSGDPTPSQEDINITNRLKECGKLLGVDLLDHIIIGDTYNVSLKEKGIV